MRDNARLILDIARTASTSTMEAIGCVFMEHERNDALLLLVEHYRAAIEAYCVMQSRQNRRWLRPSQN